MFDINYGFINHLEFDEDRISILILQNEKSIYRNP